MTTRPSRSLALLQRVPEKHRRRFVRGIRQAQRFRAKVTDQISSSPVTSRVSGLARRLRGAPSEPLAALDPATPAARWFTEPVAPNRRVVVTVYLAGGGETVTTPKVTTRWRSRAGQTLGGPIVLAPGEAAADGAGAVGWVLWSPRRAASLDIGFDGSHHVTRATVTDAGAVVRPPDYDVLPRDTPRSALRVALVADPALAAVVVTECAVLEVSAETSAADLARFRPDVLVVASPAPPVASTAPVLALAASHEIPTVFLDRHGPHAEGAMDLAAAVDVVAVPTAEAIPAYRQVLGHDRVHQLAAAAQVDLHNPRQPGDARSRRRPGTAVIDLGGSFDPPAEDSVDIFPLASSATSVAPASPARLAHLQPPVTHAQALSLFRQYCRVGVVAANGDEAACGARVIAAAACGAGSFKAGPDSAVADTSSGAEADLAGHIAYREAHLHDTWTHRLADLAGWCNIALPVRRPPKVGVVLATCRFGDAQRQVDWLAGLDQTDVTLDIALLTSFDPDDLRTDHLRGDHVVTAQQDLTKTLGDHLNRGTTLIDADYYAKIDDDDLYGDRYFTDMMLAARFSNADVVGKHCHYAHLQASNTSILRFPGSEHRFTHWIAGPTLIWKAAVMDKVSFPSLPRGSDLGFLNRVIQADLGIYAADRFNFTLIRRADSGSHTWKPTAMDLTDNTNVEPAGDGIPGFAFG